MKYLDWKIKYLHRNGMVSGKLVAADINFLCQLIDNDQGLEDNDNFVINEALAYVLHSFLPVLNDQTNMKIMGEESLQEALVNLVDIVNLKCKWFASNIVYLLSLQGAPASSST
jgi:hypothetical protein